MNTTERLDIISLLLRISQEYHDQLERNPNLIKYFATDVLPLLEGMHSNERIEFYCGLLYEFNDLQKIISHVIPFIKNS